MDIERDKGMESPVATLLCGISGSGKTRKSKELERAGAVRLSVDEEMWRRYGPLFTELPSSDQRELTLQTEEVLRCRMVSLLKEGRNVVVDSCLCKRFKREAFLSAAVGAGAAVERIYLTASEEVLRERLMRRRGADANDICVSHEAFSRFLSNFQKPEPDEGYMTIDTGIDG